MLASRLSLVCHSCACATISCCTKSCLQAKPTNPFGLSVRSCSNPSSPASPLTPPYPSVSSSPSPPSSSLTSFSVAPLSCPPDYLSLSDKELFLQCNMDTFRASGPGGQHRNKTESAVRLTHLPTGLVSQVLEWLLATQRPESLAMRHAKLRKPVFVKVDQLQPGTSGHTLTSSKTVMQRPRPIFNNVRSVRIAE